MRFFDLLFCSALPFCILLLVAQAQGESSPLSFSSYCQYRLTESPLNTVLQQMRDRDLSNGQGPLPFALDELSPFWSQSQNSKSRAIFSFDAELQEDDVGRYLQPLYDLPLTDKDEKEWTDFGMFNTYKLLTTLRQYAVRTERIKQIFKTKSDKQFSHFYLRNRQWPVPLKIYLAELRAPDAVWAFKRVIVNSAQNRFKEKQSIHDVLGKIMAEIYQKTGTRPFQIEGDRGTTELRHHTYANTAAQYLEDIGYLYKTFKRPQIHLRAGLPSENFSDIDGLTVAKVIETASLLDLARFPDHRSLGSAAYGYSAFWNIFKERPRGLVAYTPRRFYFPVTMHDLEVRQYTRIENGLNAVALAAQLQELRGEQQAHWSKALVQLEPVAALQSAENLQLLEDKIKDENANINRVFEKTLGNLSPVLHLLFSALQIHPELTTPRALTELQDLITHVDEEMRTQAQAYKLPPNRSKAEFPFAFFILSDSLKNRLARVIVKNRLYETSLIPQLWIQ